MRFVQILKSFLIIILLFFVISCQDSFELPPDANNGIGNFNIRTGQSYFESNAHDLVSLRFTDSLPATLAMFCSSAELILEWKSAMQSNHPNVSIVEVLINSKAFILSIEKRFKDEKNSYSKINFRFRTADRGT